MKRKILIADDSAVMRKNLKSILTSAGFEVVAEAANGDEAVKGYREHRPDLVTMDVTMPVMNGIEAVGSIVALDPNAVILVISAFDQRSMLFEALEKGAKRYIVKPITADKLLSAVDSLLGSGEASASDQKDLSLDAGDKTATAADQTPASAPIAIENRNGTFCLQITAHTTEASVEAVRPVMQGLLFVRPLMIAVDFGMLPSVTDQLLLSLDELLTPVAAAGGQISYIAADAGLRDRLQARRADLLVRADAR